MWNHIINTLKGMFKGLIKTLGAGAVIGFVTYLIMTIPALGISLDVAQVTGIVSFALTITASAALPILKETKVLGNGALGRAKEEGKNENQQNINQNKQRFKTQNVVNPDTGEKQFFVKEVENLIIASKAAERAAKNAQNKAENDADAGARTILNLINTNETVRNCIKETDSLQDKINEINALIAGDSSNEYLEDIYKLLISVQISLEEHYKLEQNIKKEALKLTK